MPIPFRSGMAVAGLSLSLLAATAAVPASAAAPALVLRAGATGEAVAKLQRALGVSADGVYGPITRAAVKRFQRREGLAVDGIAGPATFAALGIDPGPATAAARAAGGPSSSASPLLERIAACESGGDPTAVSPDGRYRGKYQFSLQTWQAMGGTGDPAAAPEAVQDRLAAKLLRVQGPSAWPNCAA
ncbi:MAG TPA: transglycosylase family protein [Capillimicrobium sp.]|nr:transglycosylase family protein [Capillimicrobium sp.]